MIYNDLEDIRIKAATPDNEVEIRNIIKLFTAEYGQHFPEQGVYDMQFWSRRIGTRFFSLLAMAQNKVIAHIAVQADRAPSQGAQICFPAFDPDHLYLVDQLAEGAWGVITKQAQRHKWHSIYGLLISHERRYQQVASDTFGLLETAIFPHYFHAGVYASKKINIPNHNAIFAQKILAPQSPLSLNKETIYVPKAHLDICKYIYSGMGLARNFTSQEGDYFAVPTDIRACSTHRYPGQGFSHIQVTPSLLSEFDSTLPYIDTNVSNLFFVNSHDPLCPSYCEFLEDHGLTFCGAMPLIRNQESLVYTRINNWDLDPASCFSERAKFLAQYISESLPTDAIATHDHYSSYAI